MSAPPGLASPRPATSAPIVPAKPARLLALVLLIAGVSSLVSLGAAPLLDWDENMQSEVARQVLVSGDLLQLSLNGQPFTEKPPLFFLEMAGFFKLLGVSEATARATSAINGLLFLAALFWMTRVLAGTELAALWSLLFASSLLPLILSRAAIVEHTFNALMALGAVALAAYDDAYGRRREPAPGAGIGRRPGWIHWAWLLAAAAALGLAVLAKGPSGGAVPLVAFAGYKLVRRGAPLHVGHWIACGGVSLAVALSWYVANYFAHGGAFVREFARFMGMLFAQPLEGHSGPIYYHWAFALLGLFPWTPLLLLYALPAVRRSIGNDPAARGLAGMAVVWTGFILVVFSLVKTKLPHYSSGMYVPLALLAALALQHAVRQRARLPGWLCALMAAYGAGLGALFGVLPYRAAELAAEVGASLQPPPPVPAHAYWPGVALGTGICVGALLLARGRALMGVVLTAVAMGAFMIGAWRVDLPLVAAYNQGPVLALMEESYRAGGDLALYRNVSYAALFYGRREIDMVGTYKFTGDPARLDTPAERPLYVIAPQESVERLLAEHPRLTHVRDLGSLSLFRLAAKGEARAGR